ncbi:MAG: aminotransferase-like domain-containing protein [Shinella sp.]|uniref:aminotransferase-like domain-containing protein n=1 Tax=Shinella sp. TaxID=1870904 RepID=UPI00403700A6
MSSNAAAASNFSRILTETIAEIGGSGAMDDIRGYEPVAGNERVRMAAAQFMEQNGAATDPDAVICTSGTQHGLFAVLSSVLSPGDVILADRPTFSGLIAVARLLKLVVVTIKGDDEGILPSEIEAACQRVDAKALFLVPCLANPTTITLSEQRRVEIVAVVCRHGLIVIEDDIYGALVDDKPSTLASLYPENTFYLTGLSKAVSPSVRIGFAKSPVGNEKAAEFMAAAVGATTLMMNPLSAMVFTRLIANGKLAQLINEQKSELKARMAIAAEEFADFDLRLPEVSPHLWLPLSPQWHNEAFSEQLRAQEVFVLGGSGFAVTPREALPSVRGSVSAPRTRAELRRGLAIIARTMRLEPHLTSLSV